MFFKNFLFGAIVLLVTVVPAIPGQNGTDIPANPTAGPPVPPPINPTAGPPVPPPINPTAGPTVAPPINPTAGPPVPPPSNQTVGPTVPPPVNPNPPTGNNAASKAGLLGICVNNSNCEVPNSVCGPSPFGDGFLRCKCADDFHVYQQEDVKSCLKINHGSDVAECQTCQSNEGICLQQDKNLVCACPSSRSGKNCENIHVNVLCVNESMIICYTPHLNVDLNGGWSMFSRNSKNIPQCVGSVQTNSNYCSNNASTLKLPLNVEQMSTCATENTKNTEDNLFWNTIFVASNNETISPYIFNVYCSYQSYAEGAYAGVGLVSSNGNDRGEQVNAKLKLNVVNSYGDSIPEGAKIVVGDKIRFQISLTRDGSYFNFLVLRCIASSSFIMPDVFAETRWLMNEGCPWKGEPTANSWYWIEKSPNASMYIMETKDVPMFRMLSSDVVYIYCTIKLCLISNNGSCAPKNETSCQSSVRRKRALDSVAQTTVSAGFKIVDVPGTSTVTVLATVFGILALVLLVIVLLGAAFLLLRRRNSRQFQSERFAMPRLRNTHQRF